MMIIKIEIPDNPEKDKEMTLNYFYEKCLDLLILAEIEKFQVSIEGTDLVRKK